MNTSPRADEKATFYLVRYREDWRLATSQETAEMSSADGCELYRWTAVLGDMLDAGQMEQICTCDVDRYRKGLI